MSADALYAIMNKEKWNKLPPDVQKLLAGVSNECMEKFAAGFNNIDIEGRDFFLKQGGFPGEDSSPALVY